MGYKVEVKDFKTIGVTNNYSLILMPLGVVQPLEVFEGTGQQVIDELKTTFSWEEKHKRDVSLEGFLGKLWEENGDEFFSFKVFK